LTNRHFFLDKKLGGYYILLWIVEEGEIDNPGFNKRRGFTEKLTFQSWNVSRKIQFFNKKP